MADPIDEFTGCEKSLFDTPDPVAEATADRRAEADVASGQLISHGAVKR